MVLELLTNRRGECLMPGEGAHSWVSPFNERLTHSVLPVHALDMMCHWVCLRYGDCAIGVYKCVCVCVSVCVYKCVCVCVSQREREIEREKVHGQARTSPQAQPCAELCTVFSYSWEPLIRIP